MGNTKENILLTALHLFARNGYEAVSVSDIAGELGMTKGALYRHYRNKRDLFDCIVARMEQLDAEHAQAYELPEGTLADMGEAYQNASMQQLISFSRAQFSYWTEEEFPAAFRKMLTVEQFRNEEMKTLYQQYLGSGPLGYVTDLFRSWNIQDAQQEAIAFYAPMHLLFSLSDSCEDKSAAAALFAESLERYHFGANQIKKERL